VKHGHTMTQTSLVIENVKQVLQCKTYLESTIVSNVYAIWL